MPPTTVGMAATLAKIDALAKLGGHHPVAVIGTNLTAPPYPFYLEYGTRFMQAYPTARPAYDGKRDEAYKVIGDVLGQLVRSGRRDPEILRLAMLAGGQRIQNQWKRNVMKGPVPSHLRRGQTVTNLVNTGTYARSIHVAANITGDTSIPERDG